MTFYQELKEFFKKKDPQRLYMANKIARKFRKGTEQKVVMNRLEIIYNTGGPSKIVIEDRSLATPVLENIAEEVVDNTVEEQGGVDVEIDVEIEGGAPDVEIDIPEDEK